MVDNLTGKFTIDTLRTQPNKSLKVTRDNGSHGNKRGQQQSEPREPEDQIDITISADEVEIESTGEALAEDKKTSKVSLKTVYEAMMVQSREEVGDADPSYRKALNAYGSQASTASKSKLVDEDGHKTVLGKLQDLIDKGFDVVEVDLGQPYERLIGTLWSQECDTR